MDGKNQTSSINLPAINLSNLSYLKCYKKTQKTLSHLSYWRLYFVDVGSLTIEYADEILQINEGEYCLIGRKQNHLLKTLDQPVKILLIEFTGKESETPFLSDLLNQTYIASEEQLVLLGKIFSNSRHLFTQEDSSITKENMPRFQNHFFQMQLVLIYFLEFLFLTNQEETPFEPPIESGLLQKEYNRDLINEVIHFMEENLSKNITIKEFAAHFFISPTSLKKFFKEDTGYSLINYFRTLKMEQAKRWIREDDQLFTTIAQNLGYDSIHQFSKTFKRYTGLSPTTYKKSIHSIDEQFDSLL